ncbi:NAD-dependent epimerase/dehydratase family protein [Kordiimonas marina]|uniref:NAD-dependent epimerase/dehydratase family protein n=1 Tax=Kordiimonas marina TaxID=2872312 RepID=UPI001FF4EAC7|nr:NAD-dependent epimerase/dehydratase family protein [Kordiimonas marina]MCJ9429967.1 NAD-dependent epimerase/dehydratase family protein [Kordiimonas marina]
MIYVIGGNGFVGSAFARLFDSLALDYRIIDRATYDSFRGTSCDLVINANGNSRKYISVQDPLADFDMSVRSVADSLEAFKADKYVFLSSGDVYPAPITADTTDEGQVIDVKTTSRYGLHKYMAEQLVMGAHDAPLVIRMGGMVGPNLKKNPTFDMLTGGPVWLSPASELQYCSTDRVAAQVWALIGKGITGEVVNVGGRGTVNLGQLHRHIGSNSEFKADAPTVFNELSTDKLQRLTGLSVPDSASEVADFVATWKATGGQPA